MKDINVPTQRVRDECIRACFETHTHIHNIHNHHPEYMVLLHMTQLRNINMHTTHIHTQLHAHIHLRTQIQHTQMHTLAHTCIHTHKQIQHTHTQIQCTHMHTHAHTQTNTTYAYQVAPAEVHKLADAVLKAHGAKSPSGCLVRRVNADLEKAQVCVWVWVCECVRIPVYFRHVKQRPHT